MKFSDFLKISIHSAARAETDVARKQMLKDQFQSTPPRGRRPLTSLRTSFPLMVNISIHSAARAETGWHTPKIYLGRDFNPLRREGGDALEDNKAYVESQFQSTPPRGRRHSFITVLFQEPVISIHSAARAET